MIRLLTAFLFCLLALPGTASAQGGAGLGALAAQDLRLAAIAEALQAANAPLCEMQMPLTGLVMHSADQYGGDTASNGFGNGPIAISGVVPGSAAARAGLQPGDGLEKLAGVSLAGLERLPDAPLRDSVFELLASQPADQPLPITIRRGDAVLDIVVQPKAGCRALVEIITGSGLVGRTDGRVLQVSFELATAIDDNGLAVIVAHELAHVVLQHRIRLMEAGVSKGLLGEFGRNQQLNRQVEVEADRLSPHLLSNAGYDPAIAVRFWRSAQGKKSDSWLMRSFIYPSRTARSDLIAQEISNYLPLSRGPSWPGHLLALRDRPFS